MGLVGCSGLFVISQCNRVQPVEGCCISLPQLFWLLFWQRVVLITFVTRVVLITLFLFWLLLSNFLSDHLCPTKSNQCWRNPFLVKLKYIIQCSQCCHSMLFMLPGLTKKNGLNVLKFGWSLVCPGHMCNFNLKWVWWVVLDFVWPISHLTLPHRAILKVHERRSGQDKSRTAFNPCCFSPQQELGCTKSTGLLILLRVKSSNRTQMKLPGGGTFLGKLDLHHPQTSIYAAVSKYIHSATLGALWTQTSVSFAVITDHLHLIFHFYADFNIKGYRRFFSSFHGCLPH